MSDTSETTNAQHPIAEKVAIEQRSEVENIDGVQVVRKVHADGVVDLVDAHAIGGEFSDMPKGYYLSTQFILTFIAMCLASMCAYLGWVLPANTLLLINEDIGPSVNLNWVATVWTLGSGVGFLLVGRLSDIFGRKWMVLGCQILGTVGMIVGATAQSINSLIAANLLNGIAAAGQLSFGIIMGELVPNKLRGPAVTFIFISSLPFAVFGPSIARAFIENTSAGWRWSYYLGIIISVSSLVLYQLFYHPPTYDQLHVHGKTKWQQFKELDFGGIFLFCAGIVIFLIGLSWGGQAYPWKSAHVVSTLIVGGLTLVAFALYETYVFKGQALMPTRLFRNIEYVAIVIVATIGAMVYYSMTVLWPTILGTVYTTNSIKIGLQSSVVGGGILLGQILGGFALSYLPKVKWQVVILSTIGGALVAALASMSAERHTATIVLGTLGCVAIGWVDNISFPGVTLLWEAQDIGLATGVLGSIRAIGGAVAQSLYVTILTNKAGKYLPAYVTPAALKAGLPESSLPALFGGITTGNFSAVPGINSTILTAVGAEVKHAYLSSFHVVFYATIPFSVLLITAGFFVPNMDKYLGNNVAKRLQHMGKKGGQAKEGRDISEVEKEVV